MRTVLVSDVHGNYKNLKASLIEAGVLNEKGVRLTDEHNRCKVISIGDLANCAEEDIAGDLKCLQKVGDWIDVLLVGNHEYPYFSPNATWSQFKYYKVIHEELQRIEKEGRLKPAILVKDILISHAGWDKDNYPSITTAEEAYHSIKDRLSTEGWGNRYFSAIGKSRGGRSKHGGIIWEDFNDLRSPFPQIVGHTARKRIRVKKNAICIDTGHTYRPTIVEV
jgi:hypothetical protein